MKAAARVLLSLAVAAVLTARAGATRAAETEGGAPAPAGRLTQEWVGIGFTPLAFASGRGRDGASPSSTPVGLGGTLRFGRHRWELGYVIPLEAALFVAGAGETVLTYLQVEGGFVVPGTDRRLEVGTAVGVGILSMRYANTCDGSCVVGGAGLMLSPVARFLFVDRRSMTVGANMRLILPLTDSGGEEFFGYNTGHGTLFITGLEFGFGRLGR